MPGRYQFSSERRGSVAEVQEWIPKSKYKRMRVVSLSSWASQVVVAYSEECTEAAQFSNITVPGLPSPDTLRTEQGYSVVDCAQFPDQLSPRDAKRHSTSSIIARRQWPSLPQTGGQSLPTLSST